MGSFSGVCEIVEATEEPSSSNHLKGNHQLRSYATERKPPRLKKGSNSSLEHDINKLFEAISLRATSKGADLPNQGDVGPSKTKNIGPSKPKNIGPSKKSMRIGHAPGIGFSDQVSLKQALRGLSISQASEMAAMKRLSKLPGSPGVSEAGKITRFYGSVVVEAGESRLPLAIDQKGRTGISLVQEDRTLNSSDKKSSNLANATVRSLNKNVESCPRFVVKPTPKNMDILGQNEFLPASTETQSQSSKKETEEEEKHTSVPNLLCHNSTGYASELNKKTYGLIKVEENSQISNISSEGKVAKNTSSSKVADRAAPKVRHKERLQTASSSSSSKNSNQLSRSTRNVSHVVNFSSEKVKQDRISLAGEFNEFNDVRTNLDLSNGQLICQSKSCNSKTRVVKTSMNSKLKEKGEFSQSSKSSIGDYNSSSTSPSTSPSQDSILSGSTSDRPHMSKNLKWEAIHHIRKQHGNLALRHFNLLKKLGCGDIGTVYLAELNGTNCLFAIKVMDNEYLARRKKILRAQTEREILRMLDHPFLPTLYAQFVSDNLSCLIMEYCSGGDLHVLRQKQPERYFPEQAARFYVAEVLLALEYLHMLGVVYRDLKPENILVREDGHIMLTDFDLSLRCSVNPTLLKSSAWVTEPPRVSGPSTQASCIDPFCVEPSCQVSCFSPRLLHAAAKNRKLKNELASQVRSLPQLVAEPTDARSNSFVGTHEYLAPEIIKGEGHGSAVDWWTLGIFIYELLYGKTPFKGSGNDDTLANVVLESLKFPDIPLVSFQAKDLIRRLLVKEPENRLGFERGAAEIKQHPFFVGLNWALIRCTIPPQLPEFCDAGVPFPIPEVAPQDIGKKYLKYRATGEHMQFELF